MEGKSIKYICSVHNCFFLRVANAKECKISNDLIQNWSVKQKNSCMAWGETDVCMVFVVCTWRGNDIGSLLQWYSPITCPFFVSFCIILQRLYFTWNSCSRGIVVLCMAEVYTCALHIILCYNPLFCHSEFSPSICPYS